MSARPRCAAGSTDPKSASLRGTGHVSVPAAEWSRSRRADNGAVSPVPVRLSVRGARALLRCLQTGCAARTGAGLCEPGADPRSPPETRFLAKRKGNKNHLWERKAAAFSNRPQTFQVLVPEEGE